MPERQSPHSDNAMIDEMQETGGGGTAQQSRAGGNVAREVGTRAELADAEGNLGGAKVETATGKDNPAADAKKGDKTISELQRQRNES